MPNFEKVNEAGELLQFVPPDAAFETDFRAMCREYAAHGERYEPSTMLPALGGFDAYLERLDAISRGKAPLPSWVPMDVRWLVRDGESIVGTCYLRWSLTSELKNEGGHIGYKVRPSQRRRGYGTIILELALEEFRERRYKRILITCDTDNTPSARIIEKNGGEFQDETTSHHSGKAVSRYWIRL